MTARYKTLPEGLTRDMANLIVADNENDPIARQFIASDSERIILPQEMNDPIGDYVHSSLKALVHRHKNRVLLKPTMVCAVYCRFCFRKDMIGPHGDTITQEDLDLAIAYIRNDSNISEVILTGGDPLILSPKKLQKIIQRLQDIPHIRWLRIHTRVPVVAPNLITPELVAAFAGAKPLIMAVHTNHPREFTPDSAQALARLSQSGVMLLGQSVLLKGINNSVETLVELFETMISNRVKPYYLHHPDLTAGTSHFRFSLGEGLALMDQLRQRVSGICVPQYTLDIPGGVTKIAITPDTVRPHPELPDTYLLRDPAGGEHVYSDKLPA